MSEYIEREALLRALSKEVEYDDDGEQEINADTVFITIEGFPAADVAQVVRCKDCCYWNRKYTTVGECEKLADRDQEGGAQFDCDMDDTDFCSYGERKDGAE